MNMIPKKFKLSLIGIGGALGMTALIASAHVAQPAKLPVELRPQITIDSPEYSVDLLDLGRYNDCTHDCHAELLTKDGKYAVAVNFDFSGYDKGYSNQLASYQIERMDPEYVIDESGMEVNAYIDRYEIEKINDALETSLYKKLGGGYA
ncbi:hypothetical protein [Acinetobacter ursingii]|uniref:hypothetical protein n=1 Tax=Acinetobacter ursingii TaxID=108980 RepID=UPI003AF850E3